MPFHQVFNYAHCNTNVLNAQSPIMSPSKILIHQISTLISNRWRQPELQQQLKNGVSVFASNLWKHIFPFTLFLVFFAKTDKLIAPDPLLSNSKKDSSFVDQDRPLIVSPVSDGSQWLKLTDRREKKQAHSITFLSIQNKPPYCHCNQYPNSW